MEQGFCYSDDTCPFSEALNSIMVGEPQGIMIKDE
jgi:hypothetical protein